MKALPSSLIRPYGASGRPGLRELALTLIDRGGAGPLSGAIGPARKLLVVLIDGLGLRLFERIPPGTIDGSLLEIETTFPSATAPALTTLTTGLDPAAHGILGWSLFVPELSRRVLPIPFVDQETRASLSDLGPLSESVFVAPSMYQEEIPRVAAFFHPQEIADSAYSRYFSGNRPDHGFSGLDDGLSLASEWLERTRQRSLAFVYFYELDVTAHRYGPDSPEARELLLRIAAALGRARRALGHDCALVVTGDHGQISVSEKDRVRLPAGDPLVKLLQFPPTGEPRAPFFHVRPGVEAEFRDLFSRRFGESWLLLDAGEALHRGLFGNAAGQTRVRGRLGDFLAISTVRATLQVEGAATAAPVRYGTGVHGGLTPDEMILPLLVA